MILLPSLVGKKKCVRELVSEIFDFQVVLLSTTCWKIFSLAQICVGKKTISIVYLY